jgi:hypothetical protein
MLKTPEILDAFGKMGVERTKQLLSQYNEVKNNDNKLRLVIKARPYTSALEDGIKPVSKGSKPGIPPEMIENLTDYARARGMDKPESAAWAIAKTIKKVGDKTYRMGGKDVYSLAMQELVKEITGALSKDMIREAKTIL